MFNFHFLNAFSVLSLIGAYVPAAIGDAWSRLNKPDPKKVFLIFSTIFMVGFIILIGLLYYHFDHTQLGIQFQKVTVRSHRYPMLQDSMIGIDQKALHLILLTVAITSVLFILGAWKIEYPRLENYITNLFMTQHCAVWFLSTVTRDTLFYSFFLPITLFFVFRFIKLLRRV